MSHDRAWAYGSTEIEREANADAMPGPAERLCAECGEWVDRDEIAVAWDETFEVDGMRGSVTVYRCDDCLPLTPGDRVRFRDVPSLVGEVASRRRDDAGWLYAVRGAESGRILGSYRRHHLETIS